MEAMHTFTIAEAAEATGLSHKAIRNRVDRGKLRVVKRDGIRRIPHSELKRAGLLNAPNEVSQMLGPQRGNPNEAVPSSTIDRLVERLEHQATELGELRLLTRQAKSLEDEQNRLQEELFQARATAQQTQLKVEELTKELSKARSHRSWFRRKT